MKRILIIGGAGFIGSHLVEHYIKSGDSVIVIDKELFGCKIKDDIKAKHTKNELEIIITDFVEKNGGIKKKDFSRDKVQIYKGRRN